MPSDSPDTLDFALLPDGRWPGRLVVGGKGLDDFVILSEEPSPEA